MRARRARHRDRRAGALIATRAGLSQDDGIDAIITTAAPLHRPRRNAYARWMIFEKRMDGFSGSPAFHMLSHLDH